MKKRHGPFSGLSCCLGTVCLCLPSQVLAPAGSSHSLCQMKLQLPTPQGPKGIWMLPWGQQQHVGAGARHKIWEKEMLTGNIHRCTREFQKLIPSAYAHHSVTGIIDRTDSALVVLEWHCSNFHLFHYQLQKERISYAGICMICKMFSLFITIILFFLPFLFSPSVYKCSILAWFHDFLSLIVSQNCISLPHKTDRAVWYCFLSESIRFLNRWNIDTIRWHWLF